MRMRSGSGTSRTTTTSDSGDWNDTYSTPGHSRTVTSTLSPPRNGAHLPSYSSSPSQVGFVVNGQSQSSLAPVQNSSTGLSPVASRMRERDAEAMEKYKLRQRSGSAATTSTDAPSQSGSGVSSGGPSEDDIVSLHSMVTVGSVAPRRNLRPSASAAQLRGSPQSLAGSNTPSPSQQDGRPRNGTSPGILKRHPSLSSASPIATNGNGESTLPTPTQPTAPRPPASRPSMSQETRKSGKDYTGPSSEYAKFPPPPPTPEPPERSQTPTITHTRRLPFNLLSSHKHSSDRDHHHHFGHKRNSSANSIAPRVT